MREIMKKLTPYEKRLLHNCCSAIHRYLIAGDAVNVNEVRLNIKLICDTLCEDGFVTRKEANTLYDFYAYG